MASLKTVFFPFLLGLTGVRLQALVHRKVGTEVWMPGEEQVFASLCITLMRHAAKAISKRIKTNVLCFCWFITMFTESESMREPCVVWVDADEGKKSWALPPRPTLAHDCGRWCGAEPDTNHTQLTRMTSYDPLAMLGLCLGRIWSRWSTYTTLFPMWACKTSDWRRVAPFSLLTSVLSLKLWQISTMQCTCDCHFVTFYHFVTWVCWWNVFDSTASTIHRSQGEASTIPPGQLTQMRYSYSTDFNGFQWYPMVV